MSMISGNYKHFRSFARRRKWIRLRRRRVAEDDQTYHSNDAVSIRTASIAEHESQVQDIETKEAMFYNRLKACRLDRERLKVVDETLQENDTQLEMIQVKVRDWHESEQKLMECAHRCNLPPPPLSLFLLLSLSRLQLSEYLQLFDFEESRRKFLLVS
jgi:hypothetical protein